MLRASLLSISQSQPLGEQVGFRKSEVKKRQLLVNNQAVLIKGTCRHEHDERLGKTITEAGMMKDIEVLKQLNFNAVRCSHYPNCIRWYGSLPPELSTDMVPCLLG